MLESSDEVAAPEDEAAAEETGIEPVKEQLRAEPREPRVRKLDFVKRRNWF